MIFRRKNVTIIEIEELVLFKGIECLRKSKLKNRFINDERMFKEITLGYIIGTSTLYICPQIRDDYLNSFFNETLSFLSEETLSNLKIYIKDVMELMRKNLAFNMGIRDYIEILTKKYLSDLGKKESDDCYNLAYEDLQLYYITLDKLFDGVCVKK